jgi:anti-anti-sigma factor
MYEQSKQGAVDVIRGTDPLNADHVEFLQETLEQFDGSGQPHVVFDMQSVPLVDSAGLELLLDTQERFRLRGGALKLAAVNPLCREILKVTGVGQRFEIFPDSGSAVGSFVQ